MKKKIAIIHYSFPPVIGGVEFIIQAHARLFARAGHPVKIIAGVGESNLKKVTVKVVERISAGDKDVQAIQEELQAGIVSSAFYRLKEKLKNRLEKELKEVDVCFIHNVLTMHFNLALTAAICDIIKRWGKKKKFYIWCHDDTLLNPDYSVPSRKTYPWKLLARPQMGCRYVVISYSRQKDFSRLFHRSSAFFRVVPDGIDLQSFLGISDQIWQAAVALNLFQKDLVLFFPSRILRRKNYELAIRITAALQQRGKKCLLLLTGQPDPHNPAMVEYFRQLKRLSRVLCLQQDVVFLHQFMQRREGGFHIGYRQVQEFYSLSDLLLITSFQEGFGIPLLEAGCRRIPIACARIPPLLEIGQGRGFFFKLNEPPDKIAAELCRFMEKQPSYLMFKEVARYYSWEAIYQKHLKGMII